MWALKSLWKSQTDFRDNSPVPDCAWARSKRRKLKLTMNLSLIAWTKQVRNELVKGRGKFRGTVWKCQKCIDFHFPRKEIGSRADENRGECIFSPTFFSESVTAARCISSGTDNAPGSLNNSKVASLIERGEKCQTGNRGNGRAQTFGFQTYETRFQALIRSLRGTFTIHFLR